MATHSIPPLFCPKCGAPDRDPERWCYLCGAPPMKGEPIVAQLAKSWPDRGTSPWAKVGDILAWIVLAASVVGVALVGVVAARDARPEGWIAFGVTLTPVLFTAILSVRDALGGKDQGPTKALMRLLVSAAVTASILSVLVVAIVISAVVALFVMCFSHGVR